ncbi:MAG: class I SAM-dependent methyltransferase [Candidatus Geothermincolia bacterium]
MEQSVITEYDRFYGALLEAGLVKEWGFRARPEIFLGFARQLWAYDVAASLCAGRRVLDVGCYAGYGESRLSNVAREVVAIDIDERAISHANATNLFSNVTFITTNALEMPFEDSSFDVVIAMQLFEHLEPSKTDRFLAAVRRVLVDDGLFVLATPNRKIRIPIREKPFNPLHLREYDAKTLEDVLANHFPNVDLIGIRAAEWIEQLERRRVRQLAWKCYIGQPVARLLSHFLSEDALSRLKDVAFRRTTGSPANALDASSRDEQFARSIGRASLDDFFLVDNAASIGCSLDLLAVCTKTPAEERIKPLERFTRRTR